MKVSSLFLGAVGALLLAGLVFVLTGWWKPGQISTPEASGGAGKPLLGEAKKRAESVRQTREKLDREIAGMSGLKGVQGEHRVFVSAQLVYLPKNTAEPVQPLDPKMKTEDGIEVGWKIKYQFDPSNPLVRDEDPDADGFTNLEEFVAGTDPTRKEDSPAKESKLKSRSGDLVGMVVSFPEKSGGLYSVRFQNGAKRREFKGKVNDSFWLMAGPDTLEIFSEEAKMKAAQAKAKQAGQSTHVIPLKILSYSEKLEKIKDAKAGGVEVEVDNSILTLERSDALAAVSKLTFSTPQQPQTLVWDVGDIRFFTPASGGKEMGPFRVGEKFEYEGKEFSVIGRDGKKVQLVNRTEPGKEPFWVPAETSPPAPSAQP